jgi:spore maturation protein SpmB
MAKFIAIKSSASGLGGGDYLFNVDQIITVEAASATTTTILLTSSQAAEDVVTITHGSVGTPSVRDAINAALTANPGGVKAKVNLPAGITVSGIAIA